MVKQIINLGKVSPKLPFSAAIRAGDYIFVSGQVGVYSKTGELISGIENQAKQCLENVKRVLETAGSSLDDVVKVTVFLKNPADFSKMNEVYVSYFPKDYPARSTAITGLAAADILVEIECIAYAPRS